MSAIGRPGAEDQEGRGKLGNRPRPNYNGRRMQAMCYDPQKERNTYAIKDGMCRFVQMVLFFLAVMICVSMWGL